MPKCDFNKAALQLQICWVLEGYQQEKNGTFHQDCFT